MVTAIKVKKVPKIQKIVPTHTDTIRPTKLAKNLVKNQQDTGMFLRVSHQVLRAKLKIAMTEQSRNNDGTITEPITEQSRNNDGAITVPITEQ